MKFSEEPPGGQYHLQGYGKGWIKVNEQQIVRGFLLSPDSLIENWPPVTYKELQAIHLQPAFDLATEVILIGTGERQQLPDPTVYRALVHNQTGFEFMTTDAACRTYNILISESRSVVALLFPE